ncbi:HNH endonuclease signature motif containing protein [Yimella sp. cx-51]|uniref:HNH endonuclease signature motif containing protein n=1 Tax=Yimella sp. cx-51 TaxID=2770551 RepID=UPI00165E5DBC|nr:HNH endonuclease signature motif containing protein [Yimella sp. cx-51]MBC9956328.1 HNH endonuclease [Yimella sp. cx-51]QTH38542.1 HNH endonuclease [Yimella sp. cx-51]
MVAKLLETPAEQAVEHARAHVASLSTQELLALSRAAMTELNERTLAASSDERDPRGEYEQLITGAQAVLNSAQAVRSTAIARYASVDDHPDQPGELTQRPLGHQSEFADADVAPMLRVTTRTASWVTRDACTAVVVAPRLLRLAGTGAVSMYLVDKITELLEHTTPDIRAKIEQRLLEARIEDATTVKVLGWVRRWLMTLDPDALSEKATTERTERVDVRWWGGDLPGLTEFIATLPAGYAAQIITAVDTLAKQLHADPANAGKTMGECRADALLQLVMANVTCHIQLTLLGPAPSPPPGCAECDPAEQQARPQHGDHGGNTAWSDENHWHTADAPGSAASSHQPAEQHPAHVPGHRCAHVDPVDADALAAEFSHYLDDWCARASVPGSLEQAAAEIDRQESLDLEAANAHQYDAEAFEAWFAPIVDAAAELEFAPFGATSGDHEELTATSNSDDGHRRREPAPVTEHLVEGQSAAHGWDTHGSAPDDHRPGVPGLNHRVGSIPADQLDRLLAGRRATVRHAYLEPAASTDGIVGSRLVGVTTTSRIVLTEATRAALTRFTASTANAARAGGRPEELEVTADTCSPAYRVPAHIRRFVELRDEHCRYPGCSRSAKYCEADHVIPWGTPGGHTTPANLQLLCKRHHRVKTAKRWSVTMTRDGDCTWTSPTGSVHITRPGLTLR